MILIGIVITSVLYWATTNVCRYNFVIEKKTNEMNIIAAEIKPEIKLGKVYYFKELNCNNIELSWDYERLNKIVEDIIKSGRIQKDDLTIVVVDGS